MRFAAFILTQVVAKFSLLSRELGGARSHRNVLSGGVRSEFEVSADDEQYLEEVDLDLQLNLLGLVDQLQDEFMGGAESIKTLSNILSQDRRSNVLDSLEETDSAVEMSMPVDVLGLDEFNEEDFQSPRSGNILSRRARVQVTELSDLFQEDPEEFVIEQSVEDFSDDGLSELPVERFERTCDMLTPKYPMMRTPFELAIMNKDIATAKMLMPVPKEEENVATHLALANGDVEMLNILSERDPHMVRSAALGGMMSLERLEFTQAKDISIPDEFGATAMHYAAAAGKVDSLSWLVKNGASVDAQDDSGSTPLMWANEAASLQLQRLGANVTIVNNFQDTALHFAAYHGFENAALSLISLRDFENEEGHRPGDLSTGQARHVLCANTTWNQRPCGYEKTEL